MRRFSQFLTLALIIIFVLGLLTVIVAAQETTPEPAPPDNVEPTPLPIDVQPVEIPIANNLEGFNIYFSELAGEPSRFDRNDMGLSRFAGLLTRAGANLFTLEWRNGFPTDADLVIIPSSTTDLTAEQVAYLWAYLSNGGNILFMVDTFDSQGNVRYIPAETRGFFTLSWSDLGFRAQDATLVSPGELRETTWTERQRINDENVEVERTETSPALDIEFVTTDFDSRHPISTSLTGELYYKGARPIEIGGALQSFVVTPLLFDGIDSTYGEANFSAYSTTGYSEFNIGQDVTRGRTVLAAAYDNPSVGSRMVIMGDMDIALNGGGFSSSPVYSPNFIYPTNIQFMMNTTAWLLGVENVAYTFPAPQPTSTPTLTPTPTPEPSPTPDGA